MLLLLLLEVLLTAMWRRKKGMMMKRKGNEKFIRLLSGAPSHQIYFFCRWKRRLPPVEEEAAPAL